MPSYVELHCHSCFSFREAASTPLELVLQARRLGYSALALTDHDGLAGAMEFARTAKEWDLQPIIGAEITLRPQRTTSLQPAVRNTDRLHPSLSETPKSPHQIAPLPRAGEGSRVRMSRTTGHGGAGGSAPCRGAWEPVLSEAEGVSSQFSPSLAPAHLTLLAATPRGYANLSRLLSEALLSSPRGEPSLDPEALAARTEGLIALSGCRDGVVPRLVAAGDLDGARRAAARYRDLFGRDSFYIEMQNNLLYGDRPRNRGLVALARQLDLGLVATNNVHYHERARHRLQDVLVAVRHRTTLDASERLRRDNAEFYLKSPEEMAALFAELPEAVHNTLAIAERCTPHPDLSETPDRRQQIAPLPRAGEGTGVREAENSPLGSAEAQRPGALPSPQLSPSPSPRPDGVTSRHAERSEASGLLRPTSLQPADRNTDAPHPDPSVTPDHHQQIAPLPRAGEGPGVREQAPQGFDLTTQLTYEFPDFQAPDGKTADEFLEEVCLASARDLYGWTAPGIEKRLRHELDLIRQASQAGFFLRNWELMRYAHDNNLPARGRGSSVGSLVCYLLGLSGIDPIKYDLFVGRFLNEARRKEDVPDIDLDFARHARERMFEHVFATYGTEHAALVANVIQYRYPMAIRDVGKALGLPEADVDKLAKRMRSRFARTLDEEMHALPEFRTRMNAPIWRQFVSLVEELRGKPRHLSQHSGGVIISSTPIVEQVPVQPSAMDGRYICQWDKDSVADAGFIKMDFLGYPSLGHLYRSLALIEERHDRRIDPVRIPLDDPQVYEMIRSGDILGIVQIQSRAQLQAILRLEINCIEDLVIQVALIRPGPIQGGAVNPYILRCQGKEPVTYDHPCLEPVLAETKGVIIFQEQVLEVSMAVAGFTAGQAESLRRAMSRKRSREEMEKLREAFMDGCRDTGLVNETTAQTIYEKVLAFAEFGFPKSHAAAMAETAGKLAWVKRYYPLEFYCSWLNEWPFGFYSPGVITNQARRNGIDILGVDVNRSRGECRIESLPAEGRGQAIRLGFNYVKGIGEAAISRLDEVAAHFAPQPSDTHSGASRPDGVTSRHPEPPCHPERSEGSRPSRKTMHPLREPDRNPDPPHPDPSETSDRPQQIAPLPFSGEGPGVRERKEPFASLQQRNPDPPHPDSSETSDRRQQIAPLPRAGQGSEVAEKPHPRGAGGSAPGNLASPGSNDLSGPGSAEGQSPGGLGVSPRSNNHGGLGASPRPNNGRVGGKEPYASLWDFWRRTRLPREPIERLVRLGAFAFTGLHERELLWQLGLFYQPLNAPAGWPGQLPLALPHAAEMVALTEMSDGERVHEDIVLTEGAIATRGHIMDLATLHEGVTPSHVVDRLQEGDKVTVAGFVAVRQAPETAKGFVFHTLEDRYGLVNVITKPHLVRRYKKLVAEAGALIVHGHIERQERAVNVVTERIEPLPLRGPVPAARTHSFR